MEGGRVCQVRRLTESPGTPAYPFCGEPSNQGLRRHKVTEAGRTPTGKRYNSSGRAWQTFSMKGQVENITDVAVRTVSVTTTGLCQHSSKSNRSHCVNEQAWLVPIKVHLHKQAAGQIGLRGPLPDPWNGGKKRVHRKRYD